MSKRNIAIIAGGDGSEIVISRRSGRAVFNALDRELFEPYLVEYENGRWTVKHTPEGELSYEQPVDLNIFGISDFGDEGSPDSVIRFNYALIMIHGTPGENGIMQGYFELMGIPYSTCSVEVSALTFNKSMTKQALSGQPGIHLARELTVQAGDPVNSTEIACHLGLPLFVKPNASGSSFGVTKVKREEDIGAAVTAALKESDVVMLEEYIAGREVSCGVMKTGGELLVLPITELVCETEFFDFAAKYEGKSQEITPADLPAEVTAKLNTATATVYRALGCRGVVRVDYIIREGTPYFIEVNTVPGMSEQSIIPQQWREAGMTMTGGLSLLIEETSK